MMPSRGLRLARTQVKWPQQHQSRNLSITSTSATRGFSYRPEACSLRRPTLSFKSGCVVPFAVVAVRHASNAPSPTSAQPGAAVDSNNATASQQFPNLDTITLDSIDLTPASDIAGIPEQIGYLAKIGIDFGIGPTSGIQWLLEHIHIDAGLPWWASIAATAVALRVITFPFYLKSSDSMARQSALVSITKPITERMTAAQKAGDTAQVMLAWRQLGDIRKQAGIKLSDQFVPMILQTVIGYCGFKLMRQMATVPVPGLLDGGFLWLTDLTLTDGYLLMPILMASSVHLLIRLGGESANPNQQMPPGMKKFMMYGMPGMIGLITAFQPGAVCMWFAGSGAIGIVQSLLLQNARTRSFFGLAPMYVPAKGETAPGLLMSMLDDRKKPSAAASAGSASPAPGGRGGAGNRDSASAMRLSYQAPMLHTRDRDGRTIDTTLAKPSGPSEMIQPGGTAKKSAGMFSGVSKAWNDAKERAKQQRTADPKEDYKRRAQAYEREVQKRRG